MIRKEADKIDACSFVMSEATAGRYEIWTSALALAEVFKCKGSSLSPADDEAFEDYLAQDHVFRVMLDDEVGTTARRLLREHPIIKKPADAIHLATAIINNLEEFHTFDKKNLLPLNGKIDVKDGRSKLRIISPEPPPPDPEISLFEQDKESR